MMKDTPEGSTHYFNDRCGEPAHNCTCGENTNGVVHRFNNEPCYYEDTPSPTVSEENTKPSQLGGLQGFTPPGAGVERHLRTYGHLPELGCCPHDQPKSEDFCRCGHGRTMHKKIPFSANYTEGRCGWEDCPCRYFNIVSEEIRSEGQSWEERWNRDQVEFAKKGYNRSKEITTGHYELGYDDCHLRARDFMADILKEREEKHNQVYLWLLGYNDFPLKPEGGPAYWWRSKLREKLESLGISLSDRGDK